LKKKIAFILPDATSKPSGGYKIIYEYAKQLASKDTHIDILYIFSTTNQIRSKWKLFIKKIFYSVFNKYWNWYDFGSNLKFINHKIVYSSKLLIKNQYSLIVASSVETAYFLRNLDLNRNVIYFVQGYETFSVNEEMLIESFKFNNFYIITVSNWLKRKIEEKGGRVYAVIPNAIDKNIFKISIKPENRNPFTICTIFHKSPIKGSTLSIDTIKLLKGKNSKVECTIFSVFPKPKFLPEWINYIYNPTQEEIVNIYNNNALFLSTSEMEGFGLPNAEAMICGTAVITTNSGGVTDFCYNNKTAIVIESNKSVDFSNKINDLMQNSSKRIELANKGKLEINKYDIVSNVEKFEEIILELI